MKVREKADEIFLQNLGNRIASIRKERSITQVELSYRCDIEKTNMRRIEAGNTNPTALMLRKIAAGLGISLSELLDLKDGTAASE
jgi:transcriptional regulator with XRE-family HTH domain